MENTLYKAQIQTLSEILKQEKTEFGSIHRLRQLNTTHNLSFTKVQKYLVNRKNVNLDLIMVLRLVYNKKQQKKAEQIDRLKNGLDPITENVYLVKQNDINIRQFSDRSKAVEFKNSLLHSEVYDIIESEKDVSINFSVGEMLKIIQKIDKKYTAYFTDKAEITIDRIRKSIESDTSQ